MSVFDVTALVLILLSIAVALVSVIRGRTTENKQPVEPEQGIRLQWELDGSGSTEIIGNRQLAAIQRLESHGGLLRPNDLVIVWAKEFLDDDFLFDPVRNNIHADVRYLYILDRACARRFRRFFDQLCEQTQNYEIIEDGIDVVFVKPEVMLNNFVMLAAESDRQQFYSGLIFDYRPGAWLRQDGYRSKVFLTQVRKVFATIGLAQSLSWTGSSDADGIEGLVADGMSYVNPDDQLMDFSVLGRQIQIAAPPTLQNYHYSLRAMASGTKFPGASAVKGRLKLLETYNDRLGEGA